MNFNKKTILGASIFLISVFIGIGALSAFGQGLELLEGPKDFNYSFLNFEPTELIVKFKNEARFKVEKVKDSLKLPEVLQSFKQRTDVEYVEPNYYAYAFFTPNDPYYSYQWHLQEQSKGGVNGPLAWDLSQGEGTVVAVVDTGVAYETYGAFTRAPDLAQTAFVQGYDFINNDAHANDDNGHGTHVAGTIAQSTNNALGVAGLAFKAKIMPVKVLSASGSGTYAQVASGIRFAADNGAKVINLSLGGPSPSQTLKDAVDYAKNKGVLVVAAAGNDGRNSLSYPAAYSDSVMAVGATRIDKRKAGYSNYGTGLSVVAPGGDLRVDQNRDGYGDGVLQQTLKSGSLNTFGYYFYQGTSMATPHVAALGALISSQGITNPNDIRNIIETTALDLGRKGWDSTFGWGLIDAYKAMQEAIRRIGGARAVGSVENENNDTIINNPPKVKIKSLSVEDLDKNFFSFIKGNKRLSIKIALENQDTDDANVNLSLAFKNPQGQNLNWLIYDANLNNILVKGGGSKDLTLFARTDKDSFDGNYALRAELFNSENVPLDQSNYEFNLTSSSGIRPLFNKENFVNPLDANNFIKKLNFNISQKFF